MKWELTALQIQVYWFQLVGVDVKRHSEFPNISRFCIGDNSFTNTRLAPITGSFMQVTVPDKDYANESAIRNKQNRIQQYMKKDAFSAEEFTDNLENGL